MAYRAYDNGIDLVSKGLKIEQCVESRPKTLQPKPYKGLGLKGLQLFGPRLQLPAYDTVED